MYSALDFQQTFMIEGQILGLCGPLFLSRSAELLPMNVAYNGSFGLVDTGQRKLLVTCSHVLTDFDEHKANDPSFEMAILLGGGYPVPLGRSQLIDSDARVDLATFDMDPLMEHCSHRHFYPLHKQPAPNLKPKDILAFIGYCGETRALSELGADFGYRSFGLSVADVSRFVIVADITNTTSVSDEGKPVPQSRSIGGASGAPVFQLTRHLCLRLVGFVFEECMGLVRIVHASRIRPDGKLLRDA